MADRPPAPWVLRGLFAGSALLLAVWIGRLLTGVDLGPPAAPLERWAGTALVFAAAVACLLRAAAGEAERAPWALFATALAVHGLGDVGGIAALWETDPVPFPSWADAGHLLFFPFAFAALMALLRRRVHGLEAAVWVDGVIAALAVAAVGAALLGEAIAAGTGGSPVTVAPDLAHPLAALALLSLVAGALCLLGRRPDAGWPWLAGGLAVFAVTDGIVHVQAATGTYRPGGMLDTGGAIAALLIGWAAWRFAPAAAPTAGRRGWRPLAVPVTFGLAALGIQVYDHVARVGDATFALSAACLLAVFARLVVTFGDSLRILAATRTEARTDALTGLANRGRLEADLQGALREGAHVLLLLGLDGFKGYEDAFGHGAGDAMLARLGRNLQAAMAGHGRAYRVGGDEFCVLAPLVGTGPDRLVALAAAGLRDEGEGFCIDASHGVVRLPEEAGDAASALRLADERMYAHKARGSRSVSRQATDVLRRALSERDPELGLHVDDVARLAHATATKLGVEEEVREHVRIAAELHDVGKMAIPDALLRKREPLDPAEWAFVQRHVDVGARIVGAAPALAPVAELVRCSHERWDGKGYPDGRAGAAIPLGSRIVAVCSSYYAMTTERPYREAMDPPAALRELRRGAGAQFDPDVVEAFAIAQLDLAGGRHI